MRSSLLLVLVVFALLTAPAARSESFPSDSGVLNVREFVAKGNGRDDDTAAIPAAIAAAGTDTGIAFWRTRVAFLSTGTFRVSATLAKPYADGRDRTTIRLTDHAAGFGDPSAPRGVIMTTSKLLDGTPTSGGKDYTHKGEGNDAYENLVRILQSMSARAIRAPSASTISPTTSAQFAMCA
jgi:hypothetical protein